MTTWYISDNHWHHKNVLEFEDRPYETVEELNEGMITTWNKYIKPDDLVHCLGDFCFGGYDKWVSILEQLNGNIVLYKGNHDKSKVIKRLLKEGYFQAIHTVGDSFKVRSPKTNTKYILTLTHYPMEIGNRPRLFNVSGHIHSEPSTYLNQLNVGCDSPTPFIKNREFSQPISEEELIEYMDYISPEIERLFHEERQANNQEE